MEKRSQIKELQLAVAALQGEAAPITDTTADTLQL
jgi:hypothetical protein